MSGPVCVCVATYNGEAFVAEQMRSILESHIVGGVPVKRLLYEPGVPGANKVPGAK